MAEVLLTVIIYIYEFLKSERKNSSLVPPDSPDQSKFRLVNIQIQSLTRN